MKDIIITLTGISGSGKTTVLRNLEEDFNYHKVITCTTREPRPSENEVHGEDYFFLDKEDFKSQVKENKFVESEEFDGNFYGTRWAEINSETTIPVAILEPNGAQNMKELFSQKGSKYEVIKVLLECPKEVAIERITKRDSTIPERLEKRLNSLNYKETDWQDRDYDLRLPFGSDISKINDLIKEKILEVQNEMKNSQKKKIRPKRCS